MSGASASAWKICAARSISLRTLAERLRDLALHLHHRLLHLAERISVRLFRGLRAASDDESSPREAIPRVGALRERERERAALRRPSFPHQQNSRGGTSATAALTAASPARRILCVIFFLLYPPPRLARARGSPLWNRCFVPPTTKKNSTPRRCLP